MDLCIVCTRSEDKWYVCYNMISMLKGGKVGDEKLSKREIWEFVKEVRDKEVEPLNLTTSRKR